MTHAFRPGQKAKVVRPGHEFEDNEDSMNKEQRKRMATRAFIGTDPEQAEISYTVQVSGGRVWLHREWEEEWDNADGTGRDTGYDCWIMSVDDLKKLVACATWTIQKSEAFEQQKESKKHDDHS